MATSELTVRDSFAPGEGAARKEAGNRLRNARVLASLSQDDLAQLAGINRSRLSLYETGDGSLDDDEQRRAWKAVRSKSPKKVNALKARRARRKEADLSQRELAQAANISQSKLSQWERGAIQLTPEEEARWEAALNDPDVKLHVQPHYVQKMWHGMLAWRKVSLALLQAYKPSPKELMSALNNLPSGEKPLTEDQLQVIENGIAAYMTQSTRMGALEAIKDVNLKEIENAKKTSG